MELILLQIFYRFLNTSRRLQTQINCLRIFSYSTVQRETEDVKNIFFKTFPDHFQPEFK